MNQLFIKESMLNPELGRIVLLETINSIFFGTRKDIYNKVELINLNIIKKHENKFYIVLSKLDEYLKLVQKIDFSNILCFPYNYYKLVEKENIPSKYRDIINTIEKYISYLEKINTMYSDNIKHIIIKNNFLNCVIVDSIQNNIVLKFNKLNKPLFLNLTFEQSSVDGMFFKIGDDNYDKLYDYHKNQLLMDDPESFLINNLERVTGDINFSTMAVKSYLEKNNFTTPLEGLCDLILWKNNEMKDLYLKFFINKYKNLINDDMTNFEGFNKFLLNLEVKYLQQWEVKELYNDLYFNITYELIKSYEILYNNR